MQLSEKIKIILRRTNAAYKLYLEEKKYYQAKRIYKANEVLYSLLSAYLYDEQNKDIDLTLTFLFHLEDWFEQFHELEKRSGEDLTLDSSFVFVRKDNSPEYPSEFINQL